MTLLIADPRRNCRLSFSTNCTESPLNATQLLRVLDNARRAIAFSMWDTEGAFAGYERLWISTTLTTTATGDAEIMVGASATQLSSNSASIRFEAVVRKAGLPDTPVAQAVGTAIRPAALVRQTIDR